MDVTMQPPLLRALAVIPKPVKVPRHVVEMCNTAGQAVALSMQIGHAHRKRVLDALGWRSASQLTEVISGRKNFPLDKHAAFARVTGNELVLQWFAHQQGYEIAERAETAEESATRLTQENAQLRAQIAGEAHAA
jgi:hypothetical protein